MIELFYFLNNIIYNKNTDNGNIEMSKNFKKNKFNLTEDISSSDFIKFSWPWIL